MRHLNLPEEERNERGVMHAEVEPTHEQPQVVFPPARRLADSYPGRIVDLTKAIALLPTKERSMDRCSPGEAPRDETHDEQGTAQSRRTGIVIALVGLLMMTISVLGDWIPWSL